jgi:hypothetical protein
VALLAIGLLLAAFSQSGQADVPSNLDQPIKGQLRVASPRFMDVCGFGTTLDQLARETHVLVGFEQSSNCWLSGRRRDAGSHPEILMNMSIRQAFDYVLAMMPGYSWRAIGSFVVVRPNAAWEDPNDLMNLPAAPFKVANVSFVSALHAMLQAVDPVWVHEFPEQHGHASSSLGIDRTISVTFEGGTMLEALNAAVRANRDAQWQLGYAHGRGTVAVYSLGFPSSAIMEQLPRVPSPR